MAQRTVYREVGSARVARRGPRRVVRRNAVGSGLGALLARLTASTIRLERSVRR